MSQPDAFDGFKRRQREMWASFTPTAIFTTPVAGHLVRFAGIAAGENVLDVGTGTGVVAITAARAGAEVTGLDLTPELLDEARENARIAQMEQIVWSEGDAEALPYPDRSFDVVVSQFGHMFAPRPEAAVSEIHRVLKPGGRFGASHRPHVCVHRRQLAASASGSGAAAAVGESCDCRRALGREL
jgi:SAM-dependent methyltransferase